MANTSVVQVWKDESLSPSKMRGWREYVSDLTAAGHQVIVSSCWYINYITYGQDWKNFYKCDPTDFEGSISVDVSSSSSIVIICTVDSLDLRTSIY